MNIEIANRLQKLRKEKGYSQEQLADALGISRQAVSKWERAEASPDTDNLICLAKLYGVSLDELLFTDQTINDIKEDIQDKEESKKEENKKNKVHINAHGIDIHDKNGEEVHIGWDGIKVNSPKDDTKVDISLSGVHVYKGNKKSKIFYIVKDIIMGLYSIGIFTTYIILGIKYNLWATVWVWFLSIFVVDSIFSVIENKRLTNFAYPIVTVIIYISLGIWHPLWVIFLSIPIYYIIAGGIDKIIHIHDEKNIDIDIEDDDEDDD